MGGCCAPPFGPAGPRPPDGWALTAPSPRPVPPAQTRGTRDGPTPNRQLELAPPRRVHTNYACMRGNVPRSPPGGTHAPPLGTPVSALRRARPPPSDVGRAPHTALRAPPWAFTLHRGCSHHPHNVSAHALSSHRGIGILAQSPRRDQRAGGRRTRRTPPNTPTNRPRSWPGLPACPPLPS